MRKSEFKKYIREQILNTLQESDLNEKTVVVADADEANKVDAGPDDTVVTKGADQMNEDSKKKA